MPSILSTNMASLYAQRSLAAAQTDLASSVQKLSSGKRINSAKDDAAGLGISEGISGIRNISNQSIRNLQNATSLVQTADGALDVVGKLLQRALTLSAQKNDVVLNASQTTIIDNEINSLIDEIGRIKSRTTFNSSDSIFGQTYSFGAGAGVTTTFTIPDLTIPESNLVAQPRTIEVDGVSLTREVAAEVAPAVPINVPGTTSDREVAAEVALAVAINVPGTTADREVAAVVAPVVAIQTIDATKTGIASASDTFNITAHGYVTDDELIYINGSSGNVNTIGGLNDQGHYFVNKIDNNSFQLTDQVGAIVDLLDLGAATDAHFLKVANPPSLFDITSVAATAGLTDVLQVQQDFDIGGIVFFELGANTSTTGGLVDGGVYVVTDRTTETISLKDYFTNNAVEFDAGDDLSGSILSYAGQNPTVTYFNSSDQLRTQGVHNFQGGEKIFYTGPTVNGLSSNTVYYASKVTGINTARNFRLSDTSAHALAGSNLLTLTGDQILPVSTFFWADPAGGSDVTNFTINPILPPNTLVIPDSTLADLDAVIYHEGVDPIVGLEDGKQYFVVNSGNNTIQLSTTGLINDIVPITGAADLTGANLELVERQDFDSTDPLIVNTASNLISSTAHGFATGDSVVYRTSNGGTAIGGLASDRSYEVISIDANSFQLTDPSALDPEAVVILNSSGTGVHSFAYMPTSDILSSPAHQLSTGDEVVYHISAGGEVIGGLVDGDTYRVVVNHPDSFTLTDLADVAINLSGPGNGTHSFTPVADTLTELAHGLSTGDVVTYDANGGAEIGGLTSGTSYDVLRINANSFKLKDQVTGDVVTLDSAGNIAQRFVVDTDIIQSTGHGLSTGDEVVYNANGGAEITGLTDGTTYGVIRIDANSFQLTDAFTGATKDLSGPGNVAQRFTFTPVADTLTELAHGLSTGDVVTYDANGGAEIGGLTSGTSYDVLRINANSFKLKDQVTGDVVTLDSAGNIAQRFVVDTDIIQSTGHGLSTGDEVVYNANGGAEITGLTDGTTYGVIRIDANSFQLTDAFTGATKDLSGPGNVAQRFTFTPVADTLTELAHGLSTGDVVTYDANGGAEIGGLTSGTSYDVLRINANSFKLKDQVTGDVVTLDSAGNIAQRFVVDTDIIQSTGHGLSTGDEVVYNANGGAEITGLTDGTTYGVIRIDANSFQLTDAFTGATKDLSGPGNVAQTFTTQSSGTSTSSIMDAIILNSRNRAELGSRLNTLSFAIDNLETLSNNLGEAYSRIVDTDYAAETANLTRNKILQEAAAAMLAQANQAPNVILSLLDSQSSSTST